MTAFFQSQLASWPLAAAGCEGLHDVVTRHVDLPGCACPVTLQFNPARIRSTAAKVDARSLAERPCFLCAGNRPAEQQALDFFGYDLLVNPYPILAEHYTIASREHRPQTLTPSIVTDMQAMARTLGPDFIVFYNGPHCGASAPDHMHLQAGRRQGLPLIDHLVGLPLTDGVHTLAPLGFEVIVGVNVTPAIPGDDINAITVALPTAAADKAHVLTIFIPRRKHRPACYHLDGNAQRLVSPGALDMCGLVITPRREDFDALTAPELASILRECGCWHEPIISVGIMKARTIAAEQHEGFFTLHGVTIGKQFHWEQQESQRFEGTLRLVPDGDEQWAVNDIALEKYLQSVISSEMNPNAPYEFLKAHAIVSRSWLMAQLERKRRIRNTVDVHETRTAERLIRYYDNADHTLFDVCADDHCQRYQGLTRITNDAALRAVAETRGIILTYDGQVVDARFSKCCGGRSETYDTCWDDAPHPELCAIVDAPADGATAYCDTHDEALLRLILNSYDTATHDFFRWQVRYTQEALSALIHRKSGIDFGQIIALEPVERGLSGRIRQLRIVGTRQTLIIGKELEIRRTLSDTHLYSSAFDVEPLYDDVPSTATPRIPTAFLLTGRGWGHGVGLCQIGAAAMASQGHDCLTILRHYFPTSTIEKVY